MVQRAPSFRSYVSAVQRVEELLRDVTAALDAANIPYAVIGGNAVAVWVSTVDDGAVRSTKDVDLLVRRSDLAAIDAAVRPLGLYQEFAGSVPVRISRVNPKPSEGVHLIFADEKMRSRDPRTAPALDGAMRADEGFLVIDLPSLVRMKLEAFRRVDQVHLDDLLRLGLIDETVQRGLPADLRARLQQIIDDPQEQLG